MPTSDTLIRRAHQLDSAELLEAIELSTNGLATYLARYRQTHQFDVQGVDLLKELMTSCLAIYTLAEELEKKQMQLFQFDGQNLVPKGARQIGR
jgi:hypothetical protein